MKNVWSKCRNYPMSEVWTKFKRHKLFAMSRSGKKLIVINGVKYQADRLPKSEIKRIKEEEFFKKIELSRKQFDSTPIVISPKLSFK